MLEKIKSLWSKYKIHVTVVSGALVVASVYGQCSFEPSVGAVEEAAEEVGAVEEAAEEAETTTVNTTEVDDASVIIGEANITTGTTGTIDATTENTSGQ